MERHRLDHDWQAWRGFFGVVGAVLFVVAGSMLLAEDVFDDQETVYRALALMAYGLAIVSLLAGLPGRLLAGPRPGAPDAGARPAASDAP